MSTTNPLLRNHFYKASGVTYAGSMTLQGCIEKSLLLLMTVIGTAYFTFHQGLQVLSFSRQNVFFFSLLQVGIARLTSLNPARARWTAFPYAFVQGIFFGNFLLPVSYYYTGLLEQAFVATVTVFCATFLLFRTNLVPISKLHKVVSIGLLSLVGIYFYDLIASWFGYGGCAIIHSSSPLGIMFSFAVVVLAILFLLTDLEMIERWAEEELPKEMEWYGAFALMVTLVWLYVEILGLLMKLRGNRN